MCCIFLHVLCGKNSNPIGTKTNTGNDIEKAGLTNGNLWGPAVNGFLVEISAAIPVPGTPFTMKNLGDVHNLSGATINTNSNTAGITQFLRPEDGNWDPLHPEDFYFVTTNGFNSPSRLWKLHFSNINDLTQGGTITAVLDGTEGQQMLDNITIDHWGHIFLQEDVGNNQHNGKIWQYTIATDEFKLIARHDVAKFGDIGIPATAPYNQDEESSGIIDVQEILGAGMFLMVDQAHYAIPGEVVEGGQLLALYNPDTYNACSNYSGTISVSPSPTVAGQLPNTIFLGYGSQSVTLTASVAAGFPPYTYSWSPGGATTNAITVNPITTTTYIVTIKNLFGCSTTVSQTITVKDIRDGDKNKVFICHNGHTQSVSVNAVPAHLAHGDQLGNCNDELISGNQDKLRSAEDIKTPDEVTLYPNPVHGKAFILLNLKQDEAVNIIISDAQGTVVSKPLQKNLKVGNQQVEMNTGGLVNGLYFVQVAYRNIKYSIKMTIMN
ncbi:MAG: T9SS type A sorting domain-containing protein [Ferruginibacter sp.]